MAKTRTYPPKPAAGPLHDLWSSSVRELVSLPVPELEAGELERHAIYCQLRIADTRVPIYLSVRFPERSDDCKLSRETA